MLLTISNNPSSSTGISSSVVSHPSTAVLLNKTDKQPNLYSINYSPLDQQQGPAPNITVTASLSLSGVLQGHTVASSAGKQQFKRLSTTNHNDNSRLLQQLIFQQQQQQQQQQQRLQGNHFFLFTLHDFISNPLISNSTQFRKNYLQ